MGATVLLPLCALIVTTHGISESWKPIIHTPVTASILQQEAVVFSGGQSTYSLAPVSSQFLSHEDQDRCALYKISMRQQLYFEYIHYKFGMPDLKEFTLCMWTKFTNHTNDHPLFSYAVGDQPRGIFAWIANTQRSSYYMMNIDGHNLYRLNYPLRLNKWYHSCQSWNGRTGEWQIWVNDERVGRGFNNRLVGHVIKGGGIAISGQEQRQLGGGFLEGPNAPQGSGGMLGELTMVQLYNVALTAGKAHKDHKHHHAHHYEHDTSNNIPLSTSTQAPVTGPPLPMHPYLTGGQINHQVKLNPGVTLQIIQNGVTIRHPSVPAPPVPMPFPPPNPDVKLPLPSSTPLPFYTPIYGTSQFFGKRYPTFSSSTPQPLNEFGFVNSQYDIFRRDKNLFKRDSTKDEDTAKSVEQFESKKTIAKRQTSDELESKEERQSTAAKALKKRGLVQFSDGSILDDSYLVSQNLNNDYFTGLASFSNQAQQQQQPDKNEEREPAEAEVRMVMDVCDGCTSDPFEKALVMDWRSVPKKVYSGALWIPAIPMCKGF
ncbi:uncharacterized protein LOC135168382 [Diachasmimorpha longicaudata]|uniref:uncharacterized protein LOC135168382 n=1 Tax=Diachasmimorpha longicaudata TaxID=58733 RepID=UPI0030B8D4E6